MSLKFWEFDIFLPTAKSWDFLAFNPFMHNVVK